MQLARFFDKLNTNGQQAPQFLSDHPNPENREKAIAMEVQRLPAQSYTYQSGEFQQMKQAIAKIHEKPVPPPHNQ